MRMFLFFCALISTQVALASNLSVSPQFLNFGAYPVGVYTTQSLKIRNQGNKPLTQVFAAVQGDVTSYQINGACETPLPPGGICNLNITFWPMIRGNHDSNLLVMDQEHDTEWVQLLGQGL